ncbi:hypothetical protein B0H16DRAFT_1483721 [Mycena metata]|uniref:Uncharacterized protein n=1 Tax=Mycena metata TaxID=1033252 RepID=A0AAD7GQB0_9AGAR|nr:hypothetical protein B0H16DRAFT_1483721 [Mycena metata]
MCKSQSAWQVLGKCKGNVWPGEREETWKKRNLKGHGSRKTFSPAGYCNSRSARLQSIQVPDPKGSLVVSFFRTTAPTIEVGDPKQHVRILSIWIVKVTGLGVIGCSPYISHNYIRNFLYTIRALTNNFKDCGRAARAIKVIIEAKGFGTQRVYPANPEDPPADRHKRFPFPVPWVNITSEVDPDLRTMALSRQVMYAFFEDQPYSFYFVDLTFANTHFPAADGTQ